jgi:hypothetical protein
MVRPNTRKPVSKKNVRKPVALKRELKVNLSTSLLLGLKNQ